MENLVQFFQTSPVPVANAAGSLWLIIALPLLGAFISGVFGKILGRQNTHLVALGAVGGSFLLSLIMFWVINDPSTGYGISIDHGTWFAAGDFRVNLGLAVDHLSGSMLLVITGVGFLIHLYATEYMSHDAGYWRFFAYLNLFVAAMLTLVLADSLPLLFVGWEGVGMCSYLLIGFWYDDPAKAFAGRKAFITNRIGDFGFLLGSFTLVLVLMSLTPNNGNTVKDVDGGAQLSFKMSQKGTLAFASIEAGAKLLPKVLDEKIQAGPLKDLTYSTALTIVLLLFLLGAAGKSAQIPLYVWLPDAMAGPTPVSALIHAATMVTSGIYLFCRLAYFVVLSPTAMNTIAVIGGATALLGALIAFSQTGLKKVLAYSTVSQLGLMFLGIGAGAFWAAFLHVVTHAFFKACLFLGAGSVMHGNAEEEDITKLGGLRHEMKWTWLTFFVATLAITGIVPLSGFFSKDAILHAAHGAGHELHGVEVGYVLGTLTALCTAFYMMRLYFLAFEGKRADDAKVPHAHESGMAMVIPLVVLAFLSVVALFHGIPFMQVVREGHTVRQTLMENFLDPVFRTAYELRDEAKFLKVEAETEVPWGVYAQAWIIALIGGGAAFLFYGRRMFDNVLAALEPVRKLSWNKFYVDEIYQFLFIKPLTFLSRALFRVVDSVLIDGIGVRGTAWLTTRTGAILRYLQTGDAQSYAAAMAVALVGALVWVLFKVMP